MNNIVLPLIFFCNLFYCSLITMEKSDDKESTPLVIKKNKKKLQYKSKFYLEMDTENPSSFSYENKDLRNKASTIRHSKNFLRFIDFEFKIVPNNYEDKIIQFDLLRMLRDKYVMYAVLDGESIDPQKKEELTIRIQDRGRIGYFERAMDFKIKAEKRLVRSEREEQAQKKIEKMKRALRSARSARVDFKEAYKIDNNNEESLKFVDDIEILIQKIEENLRDSYDYRLSLDKTKEAYTLTRDAYGQILFARGMHENFQQQLAERRQIVTGPQHSGTLEVLKRFIKKPKQEKRRSLPELEKNALYEEQQLCIDGLEKAEDMCLKAIALYLDAFDIYKEGLLLDKTQSLLERVVELQQRRHTLTPHGFVVRTKLSELREKLDQRLDLLNNEDNASSSSGSE